jgi:hypothetical protein
MQNQEYARSKPSNEMQKARERNKVQKVPIKAKKE